MDVPNIIVIMVDQMKANASALWGSRFNATPGLARLAEDGVVYHRAYAAQPLCVPARIAFWSSLWPQTSGCKTNQNSMPDNVEHGFAVWRQAGLRTALIGKDHCFAGAAHRDVFDVRCELSHYGFETGTATRGMDWWRPTGEIERGHDVRTKMDDAAGAPDQVVHLGPAAYAVTDHPEENYGTALVTGQAVRFIEEQGDKPFALWVSYPDPHTPYEASRRHFEAALNQVELWPWRADEFEAAPERLRVLHEMLSLWGTPTSEVRRLVACYHAMVNFIDEGVSQILDALGRRGLRNDTIVVFCSDHGDFAGEHMMMAKGGAFWDCLTKLPLIISWRKVTKGRQDNHELVSSIDVLPTLFQMQGLQVPAAMEGQGLPGLSADKPRSRVFSRYGAGGQAFALKDLGRQKARTGRAAVAESLRSREWEGERMMVVEGDWKYVHDPSGDLDELYDLKADPGELYNVAFQPAQSARCAALRSALQQWNPAAFDYSAIEAADIKKTG